MDNKNRLMTDIEKNNIKLLFHEKVNIFNNCKVISKNGWIVAEFLYCILVILTYECGSENL